MTQKNQRIQRLFIIRRISFIVSLLILLSNEIYAQKKSCPKGLEVINIDTNILVCYNLITTVDLCTGDTIKIVSRKQNSYKADFNKLVSKRLYCKLVTVNKLKLDKADYYLSISGREFSIDKGNISHVVKKQNESLYSPEVDKMLFE